MTTLITETMDIKDFVSVNVNVDYDTLKPHVEAALLENIEEPWLGTTIVTDMENNVATVTAPYLKAIPMLQKALAYFAVLKALPFIEVNIGDEGITRTENEQYKSAYRGQVARIERQLKTDAYNQLERLLNYLESEKVLYPQWTDAPGYVEHSNYFFRSSQSFSYYYPLKNGRLTYNHLLNSMRYVTEFKIKAETGVDQFNDFFTKKFNTGLTPFEVEAFGFLRNAIAHLTVAQALIDGWVTYSDQGVHFTEQAEGIRNEHNADPEMVQAKIRDIEQRGETYLAKLVAYMNNNLDEFPAFRDDEDITKSTEEIDTSPGQIKGAFGA
jgi:hypothetical protein